MDNWTRLNVLALIFLTASLAVVGIQTHAISAPSIGNTQDPGSANRLCDFTVYQDGSTFLAVDGDSGGNAYSGTAAGTVIQNTIDNGDVTCFKPGTYTLANQSPPAGVGYANAGLLLDANTVFIGAGAKTTILTTGAIPGGATNVYFTVIGNKNVGTEDSFITITGIGFDLPGPLESGTGMTAWDLAVSFYGVHDSLVENCWVESGGIEFQPNTVRINTAAALSLGKNYGNTVSKCAFENLTGSNSFYQMTDSWFVDNRIASAWDDAFIVGSAGRRIVIARNIINATAVVNNKGATTAGITLNNDGAVGSGGEFMRDIQILDNQVMNNTRHNSGGQDGIKTLTAKNILISKNLSYGNTGIGLNLEDSVNINMVGNESYWNDGEGIHIRATVSGTYRDFTVSSNLLYNNGVVAGAISAIRLSTANVGMNLQDIIISNNIGYDDQASATQTTFLTFGLDGNIQNVLVIGNNGVRQTTFFSRAGAGTLTATYRSNTGFVTENWGATSVADGGTISHGLASTVTSVTVTCSIASQMCSVTVLAATTFTVAIKTDTGAAGTTQTVYWYAVYVP